MSLQEYRVKIVAGPDKFKIMTSLFEGYEDSPKRLLEFQITDPQGKFSGKFLCEILMLERESDLLRGISLLFPCELHKDGDSGYRRKYSDDGCVVRGTYSTRNRQGELDFGTAAKLMKFT